MIKTLSKSLNKYGNLIEDKFFYKQCEILKISKNCYLNFYYKPIDSKYYKDIENLFEVTLPKELLEFYKTYNGVNLMSNTFKIYGRQVYTKDQSNDDEIILTNGRLVRFLGAESCNYLQVGRCGPALLLYKRNEMSKIYIYDIVNNKFIRTFASLKDSVIYYIDKLCDEYSTDGKKKHIHPEDDDGSYFSNYTFDML